MKNFPKFANLKKLDLDNCKLDSFDGLPSLPNLEWLLARSNGLTSLCLPVLPSLQYLLIAENNLPNLDEIGKETVPNLLSITVARNSLTSIQGLEYCPNLRSVTLDFNTSLTSLTPLDQLSSIERVSVVGISSLQNLSSLKPLSIKFQLMY